jgi:hypothetical protein
VFTDFDVSLSPTAVRNTGNSFHDHVKWNLGIGAFFNVPNKEKQKPAVNIGIFVKFKDIIAPPSPEAPITKRIEFGIKTALPFTTMKL